MAFKGCRKWWEGSWSKRTCPHSLHEKDAGVSNAYDCAHKFSSLPPPPPAPSSSTWRPKLHVPPPPPPPRVPAPPPSELAHLAGNTTRKRPRCRTLEALRYEDDTDEVKDPKDFCDAPPPSSWPTASLRDASREEEQYWYTYFEGDVNALNRHLAIIERIRMRCLHYEKLEDHYA